MTRKEETENAAAAYAERWYKEHYIHTEDFPTDVDISKGDFIAGAEWADNTMIKKACEWLSNFYQYKLGYKPFEEVVEDFKKTMEE